MKGLLFKILIISIISTSCNKDSNKKYSSRYIGYIYNQNDSTPFTNTKFKVYTPASSFNVTDAKESFFYTDNIGYFDFTCDQEGGIYWPSYHDGAAYTGPKKFGNAKRSSSDKNNKINTFYYDTLYTTPYY
jgi:hypothetical protein